MVVEHAGLHDQRLRERERATGIPRQQHALGQLGRRAQVQRSAWTGGTGRARTGGTGRMGGLGL